LTDLRCKLILPRANKLLSTIFQNDAGKSITRAELTVSEIPQGFPPSLRFMSTYYIRLSLRRASPFTFDIFQSALFSSYSIFTGDRIFNRNEVNIENSHLRISSARMSLVTLENLPSRRSQNSRTSSRTREREIKRERRHC